MNGLRFTAWLEKRKTLSSGKPALKAVNKMPKDIKDHSIILIGPMGTGKSSTSKILRDVRHMDRISLDNKDRFSDLFKTRHKFKNYKNFEFVLVSSVLSSLKEPTIVDFGASHSVYEDKDVFSLMKQICGNFKHVFLLLPTENEINSDGSMNFNRNSQILKLRLSEDNHRPWEGNLHFENRMKENDHFLTCHCNYDLATKVIYQNNRSIEQVALLIDNEINKN